MLGITGDDRDSNVSIKVEKHDPVLAAAGVKRRHDDDEDAFVKSEENDAPMSRESPGPCPGAWTRAQGRVSQQKRLRLTVENETHVPGRVVADVILNHLERQETPYKAANPGTPAPSPRAHLPTPPPERLPHARATVTELNPKLESDGLRRPRAACRGQKPPRYHIWRRYD
ncbi:hypothetical protein EXIGLDRAFT_725490 [Exidia glandulosa HHB12029]|uniref:Uncharacterized protein n=1 Tax=Exidia glandulosa HHB12029 TaxID=1314781 RepID=A0A165E0U7_EXIGL|nr:hypothetical protein EXIGLDRAFT_725490 [Exidia glandulosa HHB12029]